jgi:hypothetical protein
MKMQQNLRLDIPLPAMASRDTLPNVDSGFDAWWCGHSHANAATGQSTLVQLCRHGRIRATVSTRSHPNRTAAYSRINGTIQIGSHAGVLTTPGRIVLES